MSEQKAFLIYKNWIPMLIALDDEQLGKVMRAVLHFQMYKDVPDQTDLALKAISTLMTTQMAEDAEAWEESKEKRIEAGRVGGLARASKAKQTQANASNRKQTQANANKSKQSQANQAVNVNVNVNVNDKDKYIYIVDYLNSVCGTHYQSTSAKTQSLIKARLKDGFTVDDFKTVIDKKAKDWLNDPTWSQYLRPETLFGTKFESYLNQKDAIKPKASTNKFNEFSQNSYNYDELERRLLNE